MSNSSATGLPSRKELDKGDENISNLGHTQFAQTQSVDKQSIPPDLTKRKMTPDSLAGLTNPTSSVKKQKIWKEDDKISSNGGVKSLAQLPVKASTKDVTSVQVDSVAKMKAPVTNSPPGISLSLGIGKIGEKAPTTLASQPDKAATKAEINSSPKERKPEEEGIPVDSMAKTKVTGTKETTESSSSLGNDKIKEKTPTTVSSQPQKDAPNPKTSSSSDIQVDSTAKPKDPVTNETIGASSSLDMDEVKEKTPTPASSQSQKDSSKAETNFSSKERKPEVEETDVMLIEKLSQALSDNTPNEIVSRYIDLTPLPSKISPLPRLSSADRKELETVLEISKDEGWMDDWVGNLAFADKDVVNPDGGKSKQKKSLFRWAERGKNSLRILNNLLCFVYHLKETPNYAMKILASANAKSAESIQGVVRRVSFDPEVLREDGWTTAKSLEPIGASGGPYRIGEKVFWQGYIGVVIAYLHDHDLGDLWKAMWIEEFDTFDLEAEELEDAKKKYEKKIKRQQQATEQTNIAPPSGAGPSDSSSTRRAGRYSADFHVNGIEHGIVLAISYSRGARPGVFWPARVMHFTELDSYGSQIKRGSQKQKVDVVFLAPYWNAPTSISGRRTESYAESVSRHGSSIFNSGPLFELESIDASEDSIQQYPYDADGGLDIDELRTSFKFSGLPKAAFSRFVDSHRLALGLRIYSKNVLKSTAATDLDRTTAGLFENHPISAQTASFPRALLHLPFEYILSQMPTRERESSSILFDESNTSEEEPPLQLGVILDSMKPPNCWGLGQSAPQSASSPEASTTSKPFTSPPISLHFNDQNNLSSITLDRFIHGLSSLTALLSNKDDESSMSALLSKNLSQLLSKVPHNSSEYQSLSTELKRGRCKAIIRLWMVVKVSDKLDEIGERYILQSYLLQIFQDHGEELISSYEHGKSTAYLVDWRKACERIYKYITLAFSTKGFGNGVSWVVTDSLCNQHLTSQECFERAVRIPAALKAAKEAGAGGSDRIQLMTAVAEKYLEMADKEVIKRAHSKTYIQRIKKRCKSVTQEREVVSLTEDSDGNGGHDTKGSRGSWKAAIAAVGAAVQAVDMIMNGECVNVFCTTRPPGHHAGRELHAMKAVSNGFCLLNNAACAALYATSPVSEGGPGLRRVCVIDIDVHHGNGTQDILCSTYDPRFLYVSIHSGGADVNGVNPVEDADQLSHHLGRTSKKGIFPGRCGDTSPHQGVLNIPLGAKVTSHALGSALVTKVTPAVEKFSPELIILSTGFDAHKNDPLGLGGLNAEDFGTLTEVVCKLAHKNCSGRVLSVLEGGYGIPCCRPQSNLFDPEAAVKAASENGESNKVEAVDIDPGNGGGDPAVSTAKSDPKPDPQQKELEIKDLGEEIPEDMKDEMPYPLQKRLDKCHAEGFMECVREHVKALAKCNTRS